MDIKEERIDNYILRLFYDENPTNPREDYNLTRMVCFHKRHSLGDDHDMKSDDFDSWDEMEEYIEAEGEAALVSELYSIAQDAVAELLEEEGFHI